VGAAGSKETNYFFDLKGHVYKKESSDNPGVCYIIGFGGYCFYRYAGLHEARGAGKAAGFGESD
jgi:hypothetical protein